MPAPQNNTNGQKHGARKRSVAYDGSGFPAGAAKDEMRVRVFRRTVEAELAKVHGEKIPAYLSSVILTAARHEGRARLLARWLRTEKDITLDQRVTLLEKISAASEAKDACLRKLGLDRHGTKGNTGDHSDMWAEFDAANQAGLLPDASEDDETTPDTTHESASTTEASPAIVEGADDSGLDDDGLERMPGELPEK